MKTVLIFVHGSSNGPYPMLMDASLKTWDTVEVPGVETRFYSNPPVHWHPKIIQVPCGNGIYNEGRQNLMGYEWALKNLEWDYMARVNASCYVRKQPLFDYVQNLPATGLFRGVLASWKCARNDVTGLPGTHYLWGGAHYVISRDVIQAMVEQGGHWPHHEIEDVAMTIMANILQVKVDGDGRCVALNKTPKGWQGVFYADGKQGAYEFSTFDEFKSLVGDVHFIRVKQDGNRHMDVWLMNELIKAGI